MLTDRITGIPVMTLKQNQSDYTGNTVNNSFIVVDNNLNLCLQVLLRNIF